MTIVEFARRLGLSPSTVSCALRGVGEVSPATRQRVRAAAAKLGYRPHGPAAWLAMRRRRTGRSVHHAIPVALLTTPVLPSSAPLWENFAEACATAGLRAVQYEIAPTDSPAATSRILWHRGIVGIFFIPDKLPWPPAQWTQFAWDRFAVVKNTRAAPALAFHLVRLSSFDYMFETLTQVFARGYRRVAVLLTPSTSAHDDLARLGAIEAFAKYQMPADGTLFTRRCATHPPHPQPVDDATAAWLEQHRPDAVVGFPGTWVYPLMATGYRVPADIGFAACLTYAGLLGVPSVAGCDARNDEIGRRAAGRLAKLIQLRETGFTAAPVEEVIEPLWRDGDTLPVRGSRSHPVAAPTSEVQERVL